MYAHAQLADDRLQGSDYHVLALPVLTRTYAPLILFFTLIDFPEVRTLKMNMNVFNTDHMKMSRILTALHLLAIPFLLCRLLFARVF